MGLNQPVPISAPPDLIAKVAGAVEERIDDIVEQMLAAYQERIATYKDAPPEVLDDAREWGHASILIAIGIVAGTLDVKDFIEPLTDVGRRRARQGFPLHDVLQANLIGTEILLDTFWEVAPKDPADRAALASVVMDATIHLLQHAVTALSTGYQEVVAGRVADEEHDMQAVVETLAGIREADARHEDRARTRGVDMSALRWCVVCHTDDAEAGLQVRGMRERMPGAAVGRIGHKIIAYVPGDDVPQPPITPAGVARAIDTTRGFKRARATLEVALHLNKDVVCYEDVVPLAMILGGPREEREAFVEAQLGALLRDPMGDELADTLAAYYAAGQSIAAASRNLFVHRHTLEYRLQRISQLLHRDLKSSDVRILLELALAIRNAAATPSD